MKSFLIERARKNEVVADCLYWYVKVEMGDKLSDNEPKTNFHLFMDELIESLQNVFHIDLFYFFWLYYKIY